MSALSHSRKSARQTSGGTIGQRLGDCLSHTSAQLGTFAQAQGKHIKTARNRGRTLVRQHPKSSVGAAVLLGVTLGAGLYLWRKQR